MTINTGWVIIIMETVYDNKEHCYGCNACMNVCPMKAITMEEDEEGFIHPMIEKEKCIDCLECIDVCPIFQEEKVEIFEQKIFGVKHKDEGVRLSSTSGGMFTAISDHILEQDGVIYGAAFDNNLKVCHHRAESQKKRDEMKGSKYVQSDTGYTFTNVKKDLREGRLVLYTGTPCQIAGLKGYLAREDTSNLVLCDIICHGVPSDMMWREYRQLVKRKKHEIKIHYFRTKINGWHSMTSKNVYTTGKEDYKSVLSQVHMNLFLKDLILRPCCYRCKYASINRNSDFTIADFWGVERAAPGIDDNKGISLVFLNTQKGEDVFELIKYNLEVFESSKECCEQNNLKQSTKRPPLRDKFWSDYKNYGYEYISKKYADLTIQNRLETYAYYKTRRVKGFLKSLLILK